MQLVKFKPFSKKEDIEINHWISGEELSCIEMGKLVASDLGRELHVVFQRAFQLNKIRYTPFSHLLLSHRREGWRSDEIDLLIQNRIVSRKVLARELRRSASAVSKQMYCMKLMCGGHSYDWSDNEKTYLKLVCKEKSISEICQNLDRHPIDVKHQSIYINAFLKKAGEEFTRGGLGRKPVADVMENITCQVATI